MRFVVQAQGVGVENESIFRHINNFYWRIEMTIYNHQSFRKYRPRLTRLMTTTKDLLMKESKFVSKDGKSYEAYL